MAFVLLALRIDFSIVPTLDSVLSRELFCPLYLTLIELLLLAVTSLYPEGFCMLKILDVLVLYVPD